MKNRVYSLIIGSAFVLATRGVSQAMSYLVSISHKPANRRGSLMSS